VVGALLLLAGLTFLILGIYSEQFGFVLELVKTVFRAAVAPLPV